MNTTAQAMTHGEWLAAGNPTDKGDGIPRRNRFDLQCPAERAIQAAINAVEDMGASPGLTLIVQTLQSAKMEVGDVVDKVTDRTMSFSAALRRVKTGRRVARKGWNGQGMFIFLFNGSRFTVNREPLKSIMGEGTGVDYCPHIDMKTADGKVVPWVASQTDLMADDWVVVT